MTALRVRLRNGLCFGMVAVAFLMFVPHALAQTPTLAPINDSVTFLKAQVTKVVSSEIKEIAGTPTPENYQTIQAEIVEGPETGKVVTVDNDYLMMKVGDVFYLRHEVNVSENVDVYSVGEPYRIPTIEFFVGLFLVCLFVFGGKQGIRGLCALVASFFFIWYLLLPGILMGYSPILISVGISGLVVRRGLLCNSRI